jgi:protein-S-isoprenylcysteine O-methyltransferase Ste14
MRPLYLTEPVAALVFWSAFGTWGVAELLTYLRLRNASKADLSRLVVEVGFWLGIVLGFAAGLGAPSVSITWHRHVLLYVGAALILGGLALRQYSIFTLGRLHTLDVTTRSGQQVVESGPYRWIRHPSYTGSLLTAAAILLCSSNWLSLACYAIVVAAYCYRIRVEERTLAEDLGAPYREYMRRTKRLIPLVL